MTTKNQIGQEGKAEISEELTRQLDLLLEKGGVRGFFAVLVAVQEDGEGRRIGLLRGSLSEREVAMNGAQIIARMIESMEVAPAPTPGETVH